LARIADLRAQCRESLERAQSVNSIFSLHALAAQKMRQVHDHWRCLAAEKPVIQASCSKSETVNSQAAGHSGLVQVQSIQAQKIPKRVSCRCNRFSATQQCQSFSRVNLDRFQTTLSPRRPRTVATRTFLPLAAS